MYPPKKAVMAEIQYMVSLASHSVEGIPVNREAFQAYLAPFCRGSLFFFLLLYLRIPGMIASALHEVSLACFIFKRRQGLREPNAAKTVTSSRSLVD